MTSASTVKHLKLAPPPLRGELLVLLLAEPDGHLRDDLVRGLRHGVDVVACDDGAEALLRAGATQPAVAVIGVSLPTVPASAVVTALRRYSPDTVILIGAGEHQADDAARLLALGASATVARPYRPAELIRLLRRLRPEARLRPRDTETLNQGPVFLNPLAHEVRIDGHEVYLPQREFGLLEYFMRHADRVVTKEELREAVWGREECKTNTFNVHIRRLRTHLGDDLADPKIIRTLRGIGYRFGYVEAPESASTSQP